MSEPTKQKISSAAEIIRKGGTLLHESCPQCGSLQIRYKGRTLCLSCGDISDISKTETPSSSEILTSLRDLTLTKILDTSNILKAASNVEEQSNLVSLLLKYTELLDKISKSIENKTVAK